MAKVAIKYDKIVPYGGNFYAMNEFINAYQPTHGKKPVRVRKIKFLAVLASTL